MSWQQDYARKKITVDEAVGHVLQRRDSSIHVSEVDHVVELIPDGATLQLTAAARGRKLVRAD